MRWLTNPMLHWRSTVKFCWRHGQEVTHSRCRLLSVQHIPPGFCVWMALWIRPLWEERLLWVEVAIQRSGSGVMGQPLPDIWCQSQGSGRWAPRLRLRPADVWGYDWLEGPAKAGKQTLGHFHSFPRSHSLPSLQNRVGLRLAIVTACSIFSIWPTFSGKLQLSDPLRQRRQVPVKATGFSFSFSTWVLAALSSAPYGGELSIFISFSLSCVITVAWQLNGWKWSVREEKGKSLG